MSIQRRQTKTGKATFRVMWRDHTDAQRSKTFTTLGDAKRFDAQLQLGHVPDTSSADGKITVTQWVEEWFTVFSNQWAQKTVLDRAGICDKWIVPMIGSQPLVAITGRSLRSYRQDLLEAGASNNRANKVLSVISAMLTNAVDSGLVDTNVALGIRGLPVHKKAITVPGPLAVEEWRHWMPTDRDRLIVSLIAYSGIRPGELCGLQWKHVHTHHLLIEQSAQVGEIKSTKTNKVRSIELCKALADELAEYRPDNADPEDLVIQGTKGGILNWHNWYNRVWGDARKHVTASNRAYDLRHTFASMQIHAGRNIMQVAAELGHAKPSMTTDTYAHVFTESQMESRMTVDDAILAARIAIAAAPPVSRQAASLDASE
jgi:integrase